jgi:hypothetical protein
MHTDIHTPVSVILWLSVNLGVYCSLEKLDVLLTLPAYNITAQTTQGIHLPTVLLLSWLAVITKRLLFPEPLLCCSLRSCCTLWPLLSNGHACVCARAYVWEREIMLYLEKLFWDCDGFWIGWWWRLVTGFFGWCWFSCWTAPNMVSANSFQVLYLQLSLQYDDEQILHLFVCL